jgi:transcriptional regulator with XRE-family HTH domain
MVSVASPYISMLESGHKYPNLEMIFKLTGALGVRPGTMLDAMEECLKP